MITKQSTANVVTNTVTSFDGIDHHQYQVTIASVFQKVNDLSTELNRTKEELGEQLFPLVCPNLIIHTLELPHSNLR